MAFLSSRDCCHVSMPPNPAYILHINEHTTMTVLDVSAIDVPVVLIRRWAAAYSCFAWVITSHLGSGRFYEQNTAAAGSSPGGVLMMCVQVQVAPFCWEE